MPHKRDRQLAKRLRKAGFTLQREKKHRIWRCPCGEHTLVTSSSVSDYRGSKNVIATARRICEEAEL